MTIEGLVEEARKLAGQQRYNDALYVWRDVCALGCPRAQHRVEMAVCLVELGAEDEAVFELETALALDSAVMECIEDDERFSAVLNRL